MAECRAYPRLAKRVGAVGQKPMYKVSDAVRATHDQDGAIVIDLRRGTMFAFNLMGSKILQLLSCGIAEPDIAADISREFTVAEPLARAHLNEFIAVLTRHHIVEYSEFQPASSGFNCHLP
jgi:hypothetical protein